MSDYIEKLPDVEYPDWLPKEIKKVFVEYIEKYSQKKYHSSHPRSTSWNSFVENVAILSPAFTEDTIKSVWGHLYKKSPEKTISFAKSLIRFKGEFETEITTISQFKEEREHYIKILKKASKLSDLINEYDRLYDHYITKGHHNDLTVALSSFISNAPESVIDFNYYVKESSDLEKSCYSIGRQHNNSEKALPIFFIRRISSFFRKEYGEPNHTHVSDLINIMFNIQYTENTITRLTRNIKDIYKM